MLNISITTSQLLILLEGISWMCAPIKSTDLIEINANVSE